MSDFDYAIIGSGQAGTPLAFALAAANKRVALIERAHVGGSCVNVGCTPSKAFLACAHAAAAARNAAKLGIRCDVHVDFEKVMEHVRSTRDASRSGLESALQESGIELIRGTARFTGERCIKVGDREITGDTVVINTGTSPSIPQIAGLRAAAPIHNENVFDLRVLPADLLVLGGGYIGLELGQGFARLGSKVTIIDRHDRPMSRENEDVGHTLLAAFRDDSIVFHANCELQMVTVKGDRLECLLSNGIRVVVDKILVAAGRTPNTEALDCAAAGIDLDRRGYITVDDQFRTSAEGVYAVGDVIGQPAFTHVSWEDHRRLLGILTGDDKSSRTSGQKDRRRQDEPLAYACFTDPQVARVGLSRSDAEKRGIKVRAARSELSGMARAKEFGHEHGFFEILANAEDDKIIGATLVGYETAELIHVFIDLIALGATWRDLEQRMHIHPTYGEQLPGLARKLMQSD